MDPSVLTQEKVAKELGLSVPGLQHRIRTGTAPERELVAGTLRFTRQSLDRYLAEHGHRRIERWLARERDRIRLFASFVDDGEPEIAIAQFLSAAKLELKSMSPTAREAFAGEIGRATLGSFAEEGVDVVILDATVPTVDQILTAFCIGRVRDYAHALYIKGALPSREVADAIVTKLCEL